MPLPTIMLERDTPAELLGMRIIIRARQRLTLGRSQVIAGKSATVTCYAPSSDGFGPSALCPITIQADQIRSTIERQHPETRRETA